MRVLIAILLAAMPAMSAFADPPRAPAPPPDATPAPKAGSLLDEIRQQADSAWLDPAPGTGNATGTPAFGGGTARGVVITPPVHPDARPWPLGMVITPPETNDSMVIEPGTRMRGKPRGWGRRFVDGFDDSVGKLIQLMIPRTI